MAGPLLNIGSGGKVVCMGVGLDDPFERQSATADFRQNFIGGVGSGTTAGSLVVQHRVDHRAGAGFRVDYQMGSGIGRLVKEGNGLGLVQGYASVDTATSARRECSALRAALPGSMRTSTASFCTKWW